MSRGGGQTITYSSESEHSVTRSKHTPMLSQTDRSKMRSATVLEGTGESLTTWSNCKTHLSPQNPRPKAAPKSVSRLRRWIVLERIFIKPTVRLLSRETHTAATPCHTLVRVSVDEPAGTVPRGSGLAKSRPPRTFPACVLASSRLCVSSGTELTPRRGGAKTQTQRIW